MLSALPQADKKVLSDPRVTEALLPSMSEAYRTGSDGAAWEGAILVRPWGFRLEDITIPVHIWHGEADVNDPLQCGKYLRDTIPDTRTTFLRGEGHFLIFKHWGEILAQLVK